MVINCHLLQREEEMKLFNINKGYINKYLPQFLNCFLITIKATKILFYNTY